jgi:O-antigen/teichoic acid export membrane protein
MRIVQPLAIIGVFLVLAMVRRLDVGSALAAYAGIGVCSLAAWSIRALRRYGLGRIDPSVGRATLLYGAKSHGATVGSLVSLRLDQVILPTIVSASALGLYAVAVSVTSVVTSIASALATVILPAAARNAHRGVTITLRGLRAALISALVLAVGLAFLCPLAIQVVYGSHYLGGVDAVRLLLPGSVALAGTAVVGQGLLALNKPLSAAASQLIGAAVTVVGLLLVFRFHGGIGGASIVSSVAYTAGLVAGVFLYARAAGLRPWFVFGVIPPGLHTEE